ncbi:MAG: hypothetical protein WDO56_12635 [Gammaproteobacteria bacterium]
MRRQGDRIIVTAELSEARISRIVWVEEFSCRLDEALTLFEEIGSRIVASIAEEIEGRRTQPRHPQAAGLAERVGGLSPWPVAHVSLQRRRQRPRGAFLPEGPAPDRTFARAHAGLSFTHFQNAFLHRIADRDAEIARAFDAAGESLVADDRDPAAHWAMGRALWLRGRQDESIVEIEKSLTLSPNFAIGHYTLGFVHSHVGATRAGPSNLRTIRGT